ncbi:MAG: RlpA-like double-psi beta-barrel domain-containing protein, partial [Marinomonas gallaica]
DRGPFVRGRVIDLSKSAFRRIASTRQGVIKVKIEVMAH